MAGILPPTALTKGVHHTDRPGLMPMLAERAMRQMDRRRGGQTVAKAGTAYRWTSAKARKAALRRWRGTRRRRSTGKHFVRLATRPALTQAMRQTIRDEHAHPNPQQPLWYDHIAGQWWIADGGQYRAQAISERAALVRLGHLKSYRGYVPDVIVKVINVRTGTAIAPQRKP